MTYVVDTNTTFDYGTFWLDDIAKMDALDPGNISTWSGDLSAFRERGGKLVSYHGRADPVGLHLLSVDSENLFNFYDSSSSRPVTQRSYTISLHGHWENQFSTTSIGFSSFQVWATAAVELALSSSAKATTRQPRLLGKSQISSLIWSVGLKMALRQIRLLQ